MAQPVSANVVNVAGQQRPGYLTSLISNLGGLGQIAGGIMQAMAYGGQVDAQKKAQKMTMMTQALALPREQRHWYLHSSGLFTPQEIQQAVNFTTPTDLDIQGRIQAQLKNIKAQDPALFGAIMEGEGVNDTMRLVQSGQQQMAAQQAPAPEQGQQASGNVPNAQQQPSQKDRWNTMQQAGSPGFQMGLPKQIDSAQPPQQTAGLNEILGLFQTLTGQGQDFSQFV